MASGAGLLLKVRGQSWFLPAEAVQNVVPTPRLSAVPGSAVRLAMIAGRVVPVLELGPPSGQLVVCLADGEPVALAGVEVLDSGIFEQSAAPPLDVALELEQAAPRPSRPPTGDAP
jgi:hypothetical protein